MQVSAAVHQSDQEKRLWIGHKSIRYSPAFVLLISNWHWSSFSYTTCSKSPLSWTRTSTSLDCLPGRVTGPSSLRLLNSWLYLCQATAVAVHKHSLHWTWKHQWVSQWISWFPDITLPDSLMYQQSNILMIIRVTYLWQYSSSLFVGPLASGAQNNQVGAVSLVLVNCLLCLLVEASTSWKPEV